MKAAGFQPVRPTICAINGSLETQGRPCGHLEGKLINGMRAWLYLEFADAIYEQIEGFGSYGFRNPTRKFAILAYNSVLG